MSNLLYLYLTPKYADNAIPVIEKTGAFGCVKMNYITQTFLDADGNTGYIRCVQSPLDVERLRGTPFSKLIFLDAVKDLTTRQMLLTLVRP